MQRIVAAGGLPDSEGKIHRLSDCRAHKVVLYFCPKDNTPGCTKEACSYRDYHVKTTVGKRRWGVKRTTYIIDEQGRISHVFKKVNTATHAQEVSDALGLAGGSQQGDCVELSDELRALAAPGLSVLRPGRSPRSAEGVAACCA